MQLDPSDIFFLWHSGQKKEKKILLCLAETQTQSGQPVNERFQIWSKTLRPPAEAQMD